MSRQEEPLTRQQYEDYERNGYLVVEGLFDDVVDEIRDQLATIAANPDQYPEVSIETEVDSDEAGVEPLQAVRRFLYLQSVPGYLDRFDSSSEAAHVAGQLAGADELRVQGQFSFAKPARYGSTVPWHQDQMLWPHWKPNAVTCWVALDACTRENGCLQFARGSHADGMVDHVHPGDDDPEPHSYIPDDVAEEYEIDHAIMDAGDAVFFGPKVYHYSDPNRSPDRRLSTGIVYSSAEEWRQAYENGTWIENRREAGRSVTMSESTYRGNPTIEL